MMLPSRDEEELSLLRAAGDEEEAVFFPPSIRPPASPLTARRSRRNLALLVAVAATAALLAIAGTFRRFSTSSGAEDKAAGSSHVIDFSESKNDAPRRRSFMNSSRPFLGGHDGTLEAGEEGALLINEDGEWKKYYLPGAHVIDGGKTVKYEPPYRFYLMNTPTTDYSKAENFYKIQFPGKTFSVDMTLTNVGCGCNLNFYLVDMPWPSVGKDNDHYCDAQCFSGLGCCAEFDMNEGNANVQQVTNHACTHDYPGHGDWQCHKWGEPEVKTSMSEFAQGWGHKIDGNKPFTFSQEFKMLGDQLQIITTITQGDAKITKTMGPNAQLQAMLKTGSLEKGMVFVTGYWTAGDMNWLDGDECGSGYERCSGAPAYISNWRLTTNGNPVPSPSPSPSPAPSPAPAPSTNGRCCWGGCGGGCKSHTSWCGQSQEHCSQCHGSWLQCGWKELHQDGSNATSAERAISA